MCSKKTVAIFAASLYAHSPHPPVIYIFFNKIYNIITMLSLKNKEKNKYSIYFHLIYILSEKNST